MSHSHNAHAAISTARNTPQKSTKQGQALTEELCLKVLGYLDELHFGSYQIPDTAERIRQFLFEIAMRGTVGREKVQRDVGEKKHIVDKIDTILGDTSNGVAEIFKEILTDEGKKYQKAFDTLRTIGLTEGTDKRLFKNIIDTYLTSKKTNNGTLS